MTWRNWITVPSPYYVISCIATNGQDRGLVQLPRPDSEGWLAAAGLQLRRSSYQAGWREQIAADNICLPVCCTSNSAPLTAKRSPAAAGETQCLVPLGRQAKSVTIN